MENDGFPDTKTEGQFKALGSLWVYGPQHFPLFHWQREPLGDRPGFLGSCPALYASPKLVLVAAMKTDPLFSPYDLSTKGLKNVK